MYKIADYDKQEIKQDSWKNKSNFNPHENLYSMTIDRMKKYIKSLYEKDLFDLYKGKPIENIDELLNNLSDYEIKDIIFMPIIKERYIHERRIYSYGGSYIGLL